MGENEQLLASQAVETRYEDMLGPLMPYCIGLSPLAIKFKLHMKSLSGPGNFEFYKTHFKSISVANDIELKPDHHMATLAEYEYGEWQVVTLEFRTALPADLIRTIYELTDGSFPIEWPAPPSRNPFLDFH